MGLIRLSASAVLCLTFFATLTVPAQAQVTSQINVTSRSLAVEPATNNFAAPEGVTTFLTTYDGWNGWPLYPFSGEVRPLYLGSTEYVTDYEGHLGIMDPSNVLVNYGELVISNMPVATDSDGDGLPNFLEVNLASSFSVDATDREDYRFDGNTNNSEWTLTFAKSAGSSQGNYTLKKKSDPNNPEKIWNGNYHLKGATGPLVFNTNNKTFSFTIDSYDRVYPETNHATGAYGITQTGQLLMHGFWMESSLGTNQKKYINPFLAQRIASGDRGRAVLYSSDGHPYNPADPSTTPYPDYTEFHLELSNFPASITQTPTALSALPWNDEFTSSNSSANYLDFRNSHFAGLEVSGGKLSLTASANQYGDAYGNLSIYSPPHLLLPLSASWDISVQVGLPTPDGAYYKGVGVSLTPENETYDIANFGATVYSFELGQDNDPATPGTFLATHARRDWMPDSNLSQVTSVNFNTTYLRFAYDASTKILSSYYDSNVSSPTRSWSLYQELDLDPTDPNSVAGSLGLTSSSQIRMALWADAFVTNAISTNQIWMDSLSITQKQIEGIFSFHYPTARSTYGSDSYGDKIVGYYESDSLGITEKHGFLLQNGNWTTLQPPGSTRSEARGISSNGTIVGYLRDSTGKDRGYVYKNGAFTAQDYPSAAKTRIIGIDASDDTRWVGYFTDSSGITRGFLRTASEWTSLNYPGASESRAYAIAGSNVVGKYRLIVDGPEYGFLWNGSSWTNLGEGRLPYAVTSDGYVIGENSAQASVSQSATYFVYKSGSFQNVLLTGTDAAIPYGFDPSTSTVTGFYLQEDQSGWNGFTQEISFTSPPIPPPALTNGIRAYLDQAFVYAPVWSNAVSFSATGLPPGLNNNSSSGAISGTPSQAGYFRAIQTAHNGTNSTDFTIPITILGLPLSLPFSDDFSIEVPNRYMPYDFSNLLEEPDHYPSAGRLSLRPTNGVLRVICPANSPGHHSIGHVANLNLPLSLSWELLLDVKIPNTFSTLESQLGLCLYPAPSAEDTVETLGSQNQLNFYFNRDTEFPESSDYGSGLERNTYINGVSQINDDGWLQLNTNSLATLRIFYDSGQKTISTWGKPQPDGSWTKIGVDIPFDPEASGTLAHRWGLSPTSTLGVTITGYFEVGANETLPEIYADNFSAKIIQPPVPPPALSNGLRANLGQSFFYQPTFSGSGATFTATNLPDGLSLDLPTGKISGTPSSAGYYRTILTAANAAGTSTLTIPFTIPGTLQSLPFSDQFTNMVPNRYMPLNLGLPAALLVTGDALQYVCTASDSDGALAAWIPNLPLPLTNSWDVVVDAKMPAGWNTPYAGLGLTLMPYEESGTIETTGRKDRLNLKLGRDTEDPAHNGGNFFARAAYTNNVEYVFPTSNGPLPYLTTNTPATRATLRLSFHGPSKTLSTWYRTNESNVWEQLGTPYDLNPSSAGSLGHSWGLSNNSTLRIALWGDSYATNGSAGQPMELDNLAVTIPSGLIYPSLPPTLSRRPGEPIFLSASPRDVGSYTYEWKKNGNLLPVVSGFESHQSTYYLGNPSSGDNGIYSLIISRNGQPYGTNSTILTVSNNAPTGPRSDNFEADLGRWNGVWGFDAHDGYLKLGFGRLQAISDKAGSENTQAFYFWDNRLPTDQSWEVTVDAFMDANIHAPIAEDYFYHSLRLGADIPVHLTNDFFSANGLGVNFAEDKDGEGNRRRTIQSVLSSTTSGWAELLPVNLPLNQTMISLRLRYESSSKTLTSSYRSSSSADWQVTGSSNFDSLPTAQLQNGFRLHLSSIAEPSFVISEGQAYFDNFTLKYDLSLSNAAVATKSFDGAPNATITGTLIGVAPGDSVSHDGAGLFDTSAKGVNKPVTANLALTGTESAHYTITQPTGLTGTIQSLSEIFFGNLDPTNVASDGLTYLMKYAYGAANPTSPISHALRPVTTLTTNTNGQPVLALTYYARTNDTNLFIQPIWSSELSSPTSSWQSNVTVNTLGITNTNGLVLEQRKATVPIDSTAKKFLRLKATLNK